ncbi:MAG: hypothetical protein RLP44_19845, partial [Aggregatilineales bacterium]
NILSAQIAKNVFDVPEIMVLSTRSDEATLRSMLSDIGAYCIDNNVVNLTEWDQQNEQGDGFQPVEIQVDSPLSASAFLSQLQGKSKLFLPLTVSHNGQVTPFFASKNLESGDTVSVLQSGDQVAMA